MSLLQWLGIWGMTEFPVPVEADLNKWTKGIGYLLGDQIGEHYFREFLKDHGSEFKEHAQLFELLVRIYRLNQGWCK
jgi:hypothetical protein